MKLTRRKTLAVLGGGAIVAAAGAGYAVTRKPLAAIEPWARAGTYEDVRKRALSYAILAPNPHNRQPWIVDLSAPDQVTLQVDTNRLLPHTDPFSRQIVIGLGCFLELLSLAAAADGYAVDFELFPDGEDATSLDQRRIAVARFQKGNAVSEPTLFEQVLNRRSLKEPYDIAQPVSDETLAALQSSVTRGSASGATNNMSQVEELRELTLEALKIELMTPHTYKESVDLFRIGHREVSANPDGIDFSGPMFEALHLSGLFSREKALDPEGFSFKAAIDMVSNSTRTGMAYFWLTTATNDRVDQIMAGRDWVRMNLVSTALGLGVQPMSQALQEFPEMQAQYDRVHEMLAPDGGTVQMLGRLGYGPQVGQSPRWPLEAKLRKS